MQKASKQRFIGLEWLRFLLGCYVMIYHTLHQYPQRFTIPFLAEFTSMGFFATSTFFVLSGFLLTHVYFNGNVMRESGRSFLTKRFCNLYPIHIVALVTSMLVVTFMHWLSIPPQGPTASLRFVIYDTNSELGGTHPELFRHYMTNIQLSFNVFLQMFMLQAWNPYFLTFNAPLWSLSTLFFFYLLFPFLAPKLLAVRRKWLWLGIIMLVYLVPPIYVVWQHQYGMPFTGLLQRNPLLRLPEFLAGIVAYALFRQHQQTGMLPNGTIRGLMVVGILLCFGVATALFTHGARYWYFMLHNGLLLPAQVCLVYLSAMARDPNSSWLRHWSPRLGAASLSIFAFHVPIFNLFRTLEQLVRGAPMTCFKDWNACIAAAGNVQLSVVGYLIYMAITIAVCLLFQEQFVVRMRKLLLRCFPHTKAAA
ncbi:acyltransferase family protein [Rouxiella sp. Mn2063]|uniref:acyltransferase family protein n=1 Tax=Rouxiella sp. Mn2063 TaxID=3395262 RepID=UPI003BE1FDA2